MSPNPTSTSSRRAPRLLAVCLAALLVTTPGCAIATLTGFVTGAFTGAVDAPAQVYRHHRGTFDRHPEYWPWNVVAFFPVGLMGGPFAGLAKGIAIDIQYWFLDHSLTYGKVFGTYRDESIWRPFTIHW